MVTKTIALIGNQNCGNKLGGLQLAELFFAHQAHCADNEHINEQGAEQQDCHGGLLFNVLAHSGPLLLNVARFD